MAYFMATRNAVLSLQTASGSTGHLPESSNWTTTECTVAAEPNAQYSGQWKCAGLVSGAVLGCCGGAYATV